MLVQPLCLIHPLPPLHTLTQAFTSFLGEVALQSSVRLPCLFAHSNHFDRCGGVLAKLCVMSGYTKQGSIL